MYPNNKPNIYNQPKQRERFQLKNGTYFWMSSLLGTYTPEKEAAMKAKLEEIISNQSLNIQEDEDTN